MTITITYQKFYSLGLLHNGDVVLYNITHVIQTCCIVYLNTYMHIYTCMYVYALFYLYINK